MKVLGIDYGQKRIGLALSDELNLIASPLPTLKVKSLADAVSKVHRITDKQSIKHVVIGLPLGPKREETQQSIRTRYFANSLKNANGTEIHFWNESHTSNDAKKSNSGKRTNKNLDSEAARIILQEFLDSKGKDLKKKS